MDIHSIIATHHSREKNEVDPKSSEDHKIPTVSSIPDIFFDDILVNYKLNRIETLVMMFLYRQVWCRPNLYKEYGLGPLLSHTEMAKMLCISIDDVYHALRKLESLDFIETIRSGQYFVRKYFTKEYDDMYGVNYDNF